MQQIVAILVLHTCLGCAKPAAAHAEGPVSLFDPARHMRVAEVKPGMRGHGLSVFKGVEIERFDVEVVSILRNFNPKHDVILIRCSGANLEHTGAIGGMSGSPIYLTDELGRSRLVGAFAYGWPLMKDPLAGVQPIEYMLEIQDNGVDLPLATPEAQRHSETDRGARPNSNANALRWSIADVFPLPGGSSPHRFPAVDLNTFDPNPNYFRPGSDQNRLQPLAAPLMVGGLSSSIVDAYSPLLRASGMMPLQAGGGLAKPQSDGAEQPRLEPGSTLAVPLVTGDIDFTLVGTVTEVIGKRVFGFGHPFQSEGPVSLPMGTGEVNGILARLDQSQKLGSLRRLQGTLTADQLVGVAGQIGRTPVTAPIELRVKYADGSHDETYKYHAAIHPRLTPLLGGVAASSAISGVREPPQHHTLKYDLRIEFANGEVIESSDIAVNAGKFWPLQAIVFPLIAAAENPFERATLSKLSGTITILPEAREAEILSVHIPRLKYKPGETIRAFVTYRPFRAPESILPIELQLPHDLTDGTYQLVVADWERYITDEQTAQPFRFTAESGAEVFDVLRDIMSMRHDAIYVRLLRQPDGVAVGRVAMPRLPSSRRQVLLGSGRSNTTPFVSSTVKIIPSDFVMKGSADFAIEIDAQERVETASGKAAKPEPEVPPAAGEHKPTRAGTIEPPRRDDDIPDEPDRTRPESPDDDGG